MGDAMVGDAMVHSPHQLKSCWYHQHYHCHCSIPQSSHNLILFCIKQIKTKCPIWKQTVPAYIWRKFIQTYSASALCIQRELYNLDGHLVANWTARTCGGTWWSCDCMFPKTGVKCPGWKTPPPRRRVFWTHNPHLGVRGATQTDYTSVATL